MQNKNTSEDNFLPFALPDINDEEIDNVVSCMKSGWLTSGPNVKTFEKEFANYIGGDVEAIAVNSATFGLTLALEACNIGQGDEVITTPYTFSATAMSCVYLEATPVLVDIDPITMNIDPKLIKAAITDKTKAIIPVHFAGLACDMDLIMEIAQKYNLKIIEDAAHALPCFYNNKKIGSLDSDATIYSFYATKTITTGEGGMIVTKNQDIAKRARTMRMHGISADVFDRYTSTKPKWYYQITAAGYKCNMTDIAASIGLAQLKKADDFQKKRVYIKEQYMQAFSDLPITLPFENKQNGNMHSWHLFVIRLTDKTNIKRDDFIKIMSEKYKIGCSVHFIPLHFHPFWQEKLSLSVQDFKCATGAFNNAISLPIYTKMTQNDIDRVIFAVKDIISP